MYEDREINVRAILYSALSKWRSLIIISLVVTILAGVYSGWNIFEVYFNETSMSIENRKYNIKLQEYQTKGTALLNEMDNLKNMHEKQELYNNNSILMKINPYDEYIGVFSIYIDTGYQIMPELSYQNTDKTSYIIDTYESYICSGELYRDLNIKHEQIIEENYLKEIIQVNKSSNILTVTIKNIDQESCEELVNDIKLGLEEKSKYLRDIMGDYNYSITNESYYSTVDLELDELQQTKRKSSVDLVSSLAEKSNEYNIWLGKKLEPFEYAPSSIVKSIMKAMVYKGGIAFALVFMWYIIRAIITNNVMSAEEFKSRLNIQILGEIPSNKKKKKNFIDRKLRSLFGINIYNTDYKLACKLASTNISACMSSNNEPTTVFMQNSECNCLSEIISQINTNEKKFFIADNIYESSKAIDIVKNADSVILVETLKKSQYTNIQKEVEQINLLGKKLLGVILVDTDN